MGKGTLHTTGLLRLIRSVLFVRQRRASLPLSAHMLTSMAIGRCLVLGHLEVVGVKTRGTQLRCFHLLSHSILLDAAVCIVRGLMCCSCLGSADRRLASIRTMMVMSTSNLHIVTAVAPMRRRSIRLRGGEERSLRAILGRG